jgi:hypothetical protein
MTFEREMDRFFTRNCVLENEREKVKASPAYRLAAETNDTTQAQETATLILEARPPMNP